MAFDPDAYLSGKSSATNGFDPDAYLAGGTTAPTYEPQVIAPEEETLSDRIHKFLFTPEGAQTTREAIQGAVKSIPHMAVDTAKMGYKGLRMAMGGPEERARIMTEDVIPSALSQGQQTAEDIQAPFGTAEWLRGAGQVGMMALPGLEAFRELRAPVEIPREIPPIEAPPVQVPLVEPPPVQAPLADLIRQQPPEPTLAERITQPQAPPEVAPVVSKPEQLTSWEPDLFELNDWVAMKNPQLYAATKGLSDAHLQYETWLKQWRESGSPDISGVHGEPSPEVPPEVAPPAPEAAVPAPEPPPIQAPPEAPPPPIGTPLKPVPLHGPNGERAADVAAAAVEERVQHGQFAEPGYTAVETAPEAAAPAGAPVAPEAPVKAPEAPVIPPEPLLPYTPEAAAARAAEPPPVPPEAEPVSPAGRPSKIGQSIEAKAVEAKLTEGFKETALYDPITIKDQAARATDIVGSSPETARAIVRGDAPLPEGLRGTSLITAMEERLLREPDAHVAYELANSPLTSATSAAAQEMRLMRERVPDSIAAKFQEIRAAREAGAKRRGDIQNVAKTAAKEIKTEVTRLSEKRPTWEAFVREITC